MKLIVAIIQDEDASKLLDKLSENGFYSTRLATSGGFLRAGNTTILIGVEDEKVEDVCSIIEKNCKSRKQITPVQTPMLGAMDVFSSVYPIEVNVGGATVFVLDVEKFRKY